MVTESLVPLKSKPNFKITLISYYNPDVSAEKDLSKIILERNTLVKKVIIAGDFNQISNYENDNWRFGAPLQQKTISENIKKANKFKTLIDDCGLIYETGFGLNKSKVYAHSGILIYPKKTRQDLDITLLKRSNQTKE